MNNNQNNEKQNSHNNRMTGYPGIFQSICMKIEVMKEKRRKEKEQNKPLLTTTINMHLTNN